MKIESWTDETGYHENITFEEGDQEFPAVWSYGYAPTVVIARDLKQARERVTATNARIKAACKSEVRELLVQTLVADLPA